MNPRLRKKIVLQILSVNLIRLAFIAAMILGLANASTYTKQDFTTTENNNSRGVNVIAFKSSEQSAHSQAMVKSLNGDCTKKVECIIHPIILKAASKHELDPALIKAIIMAESGYKIRAISKRGAKGLMQLMPETAEDLGVIDIFNPKENISGGVRYFKQLVDQFEGDIKLALAAYNAGSRKVIHYNGIPPYKSTQYYIKKVFKYYNLYKNQMTVKIGKA